MIEVLQFVFRDFWTWLGAMLMLGVIASCVSAFLTAIVMAVRGR